MRYVTIFVNYESTYPVGGNYSTTNCVGCAALFPEPLPHL